MGTITITKLPEGKTKSGKTKYSIEVKCKCGWGTEGNNTFSMDHLVNWGNKMAEWHNTREHS